MRRDDSFSLGLQVVSGRAVSSLKLAALILASCALALNISVIPARSERLPIKSYTTADGLALDRVNQIANDSRGFLWFCTDEGLSRFDGYRFTNYGEEEGLPHHHVNDLLEARNGVYWVATDGGLCRFNPSGTPMPFSGANDKTFKSAAILPLFSVYLLGPDPQARYINDLFEDRGGALWCATNGGLYRQREDSEVRFDRIDIGAPETGEDAHIHTIVEDNRGDLWLGSSSGLYRRHPDGTVEHYSTSHGLPDNLVEALFLDGDGSLWAGTRYGGLCHIGPDTRTGRTVVSHVYTTKDGLAANEIGAIVRSSDGRLWVGTDAGLCEFKQTGDNGARFRAYTQANGITTTGITALAEDRGHNLWIATTTGGALRLARGGFTTYAESDGLPKREIISLFHDDKRDLCVITGDLNHEFISCFDGARFVTVQPRLSSRRVPLAWGRDQITFQDREGEWWASTEEGLLRFAKAEVLQLGSATASEVVTGQLEDKGVDAVYEDSRGDVWIALNSYKVALARWDRTTGGFQAYANIKGLPPPGPQLPIAFREDRSGNLWIGYNNGGGLVRYHDGQFRLFTTSDGVPDGSISAIYPDRAGRLWIADGEGGLLRVDDPDADHPHFITYTTANGLSSSIVWCITEDRFGRIYAGSGRGVDVIEPASESVAHYTAADGLGAGAVRNALADDSGGLWLATSNGVSHLSPREPVQNPPSPVLITGVRIGGKRLKISELGESAVQLAPLGPSENQVQIDFVAMNFAPGESTQYRYKLEGADNDWNPPSDVRGISYANLRPGRYRFLVTTVGSNGVLGAGPAIITFRVLPPIWLRWWFVSVAVLVLALTAYSLYRFRVNRLLELERVRTRIATDLHDDMGSSLSRIAILSEALLIQSPESANGPRALLGQIAETSRTLIDGMSDVIWSIDPRLDNLADLIFRVRKSATDVFDAQGIRWEFKVPADPENIKLTAEQRRHIYLIIRELINNIARHSKCTSAALAIEVDGRRLVIDAGDDGCGFSRKLFGDENSQRPGQTAGHGLENMKNRAARLGGALSVDSAPGRGTHIRVELPIRRGVAWRKRA